MLSCVHWHCAHMAECLADCWCVKISMQVSCAHLAVHVAEHQQQRNDEPCAVLAMDLQGALASVYASLP